MDDQATDADDRVDLTTLTLDLASLTLGEMAEVEMQSGRSMDRLLTAGAATRRLLALWVSEQRSSAQPRTWHELSSLRPLARSSLTSPASPDGDLRKSRA